MNGCFYCLVYILWVGDIKLNNQQIIRQAERFCDRSGVAASCYDRIPCCQSSLSSLVTS